MNSEPQRFDDLSLSELADQRLLQSTFSAPPMRPRFVEQLSHRLDDEFRLQVASHPANGAHANGKAHDDQTPATLPIGGATPISGATQGRKLFRAVAAVAAAATLILAFGFWGDRPAYGWAAMLEALERCEWVQAVTQSGKDNSTPVAIGWFSESKQIAAREAGDARVYLKFRDQVAEDFNPSDQVIYKRKLKQESRIGDEFLALMLTGNSSAPSSALSNLEVLEEKWQESKEPNTVELRVSVRERAEKPSEPIHLVFLIDAKTHLPITGKVEGNRSEQAESIEFSYPEQGPESIFALGVPEQSQVVIQDAVVDVETAPVNEPERKTVVEELVVVGEPQISAPEDVELPAEETKSKAVAEPPRTLEQVPRIASHDVIEKPAIAAEPLAPEELTAKLDQLLADFWKAQGISPVEPASDTEFLRRIYLDLTGRIPMVSEVHAFLGDPNPDRRERLVDDLLTRRDHATHLAAVWRTVLLPEGIDFNAYGGTRKFDAWLADRFGQNVPYDEIVRQLLLAEGRVSESGPLLFYASLKLNPEEIAAKTSRVFLGTRMECAQCHDHPFDDRIAQNDFWGFAAHFAQISRPQGKMEMTSSVLRVHDNDFGEVTLPDEDTVIPPKLPGANPEPLATELNSSRRQQLADWLTNQNNNQFSRAAVNRVWQQLFGRGLVEPVDDMRPDNAAICPEALELLSQDFAASGFDLRRLIRALVLTDAYQLSSGSDKDDPSQSLCFARMNMKYFTADQLYDCIAVATRNESLLGNSADGSLARTENMSRQAFIEQFRSAGEDRTDYQAGVPQALTLMHGSIVHGATDLAQSSLLKSLNAPFFSDDQRLEIVFMATLSRTPSPEEQTQLLEYLQTAKDSNERLGLLGDVLWALLNSAEFTFIH